MADYSNPTHDVLPSWVTGRCLARIIYKQFFFFFFPLSLFIPSFFPSPFILFFFVSFLLPPPFSFLFFFLFSYIALIIIRKTSRGHWSWKGVFSGHLMSITVPTVLLSMSSGTQVPERTLHLDHTPFASPKSVQGDWKQSTHIS